MRKFSAFEPDELTKAKRKSMIVPEKSETIIDCAQLAKN